jgi:uncharacterized protein YggT (Ycf19 family)
MGVVDFILNLAGLLLWLNWRAEKADPVGKRKPATLIGTLRRMDARATNWQLPALIGGLLLLRALFYWQIGSALRWSGKVDVGVVVLSFPIPANSFFSFGQTVLFSTLSFALTLAFFYLSLLLLSILDGPEPFRTFVRLQLGAIDRWARLSRLFFPVLAGTLLWWTASWLFNALHIVPPPAAEWRRAADSLVIGLGSYLAWKYIAIALLALHLLNSYIYFGKHPFWDFVNAEARTLLSPLKKLPLRFAKIDMAPLLGILLVWGLAWLAGTLLSFLHAKLAV